MTSQPTTPSSSNTTTTAHTHSPRAQNHSFSKSSQRKRKHNLNTHFVTIKLSKKRTYTKKYTNIPHMSVATPIMSQRQPHHQLFNGQSADHQSQAENSIAPPPPTERRPFVARANLFLNFAQQRRNISVRNISIIIINLNLTLLKGYQPSLANSNLVTNITKWNNLLTHSNIAKFTSLAN